MWHRKEAAAKQRESVPWDRINHVVREVLSGAGVAESSRGSAVAMPAE